MTNPLEDQFGYELFYIRAIQNHRRGLKLALGGTGLGKTSGLYKAITFPEFSQQKSIYLAPLKQLVEDVGHQEHCLILHSDRDTVFFTLRDKKREFYDLFQNEESFRRYVHRWNDDPRHGKIDFTKVKRALQTFEDILSEYRTIPSNMEDQIAEPARLIMQCFRSAVLGAKTKKRNSPGYLYLLDHPIIQALFPFIAFKRRSEIRLIAMTIHKAYYGFFDGEKSLNLTKLEGDDGGYIIYADEFDYLENILAHLICQTAQVTNPIHFVQLFYHNMEYHKLPYALYPGSKELREYINAIQEVIKELQKMTNLQYPTYYHFTSALPETNQQNGKKHPASQAIFRTNHIVRTTPIAVRQTERGFELYTPDGDVDNDEHEPPEKVTSALRLFDTVSYAVSLIIQFFQIVRWTNDELTYREIVRQCYRETIYIGELEKITQYAHHHGLEDGTDLGALIERGYSYYDIYHLQQVTDNEEVEVEHYGIHTTPEAILRSMAQNNLVFGLSATADIPRYVHHFHLKWLRQQVEVHEPTAEDIDLIRTLNNKKADMRGNTITLDVLTELNSADEFQHLLHMHIRQVAKDENFGEDKNGYRKKRIELFFAILLRLSEYLKVQKQEHVQNEESEEILTSLLFLNTFTQIKLLFDLYPQPESNIFRICQRSQSRDLQVYDLEMKEHVFLVVFYNARQGNKMRQLVHIQHEFDQLFWMGKPVVVVTQYKSAGIGINLQYWSSSEKKQKRDFTTISLLEAPYYYFGDPEEELDEAEKITLRKQNLWYLGKLYSANLIQQREFRQMLQSLHHSSSWNNEYHNGRYTRQDAQLNALATFKQALGRIERIRDKMPAQRVFMSSEVYKYFQRFCSPVFDDLRADRDAFISGNLRQILQQVSDALPKEQRMARYFKDSLLPEKNNRNKEALDVLLARLEKIRQGMEDSEAREHWHLLRQGVLKQDFDHPVLQQYECITESPHYQEGMLLLTPDGEILPPHLIQPDTYFWKMDKVYRVVTNNLIIRDHFTERNYPFQFPLNGKRFLTPNSFQALLKGAIGEEAICALLEEEGIELEALPDPLIEVADLKIRDYPYYIDCKYYTDFTLKRFSLPDDDPNWHHKLNDEAFRESAKKKVERLQAYHQGEVKLIYINLASTDDHDLRLFDLRFQDVSFKAARIIIVPGALQQRRLNSYQPVFERFLRDFHELLAIKNDALAIESKEGMGDL